MTVYLRHLKDILRFKGVITVSYFRSPQPVYLRATAAAWLAVPARPLRSLTVAILAKAFVNATSFLQ